MNSKTWILPLAGLALLAGAAAALAQNIAVINGQGVPKARLDAIVQQVREQAQAAAQPLPPNIEDIIRAKLIENTVLVQAAESQGLQYTQQYRTQMQNQREATLIGLLFKHYDETHPVSDAAIKAEYDKIAAQSREYQARHILLQTEQQARDALARLAKGEKFADLARSLSQDPGSAAKGGDLGWSAADAYDPAFAQALVALQKGQISPQPVRTQFGYHIIEQQDVRASSLPPLEAIKDQIRQQLQQEQLARLREGLFKKAGIPVKPPLTAAP